MTETSLDEEIRKIVIEEIKKHETKLKKEDAIEIIETILPEIEVIVSKIIIKHFKVLAKYIQETFKD